MEITTMKHFLACFLAILFPILATANEITVKPTVTAASTNYSAGDCIGGLMTFRKVFGTIPNTGAIQTVIVSDIGAEGQNMELLLFPKTPNGTFTDNAACDPSDTDIAMMRVVQVNTHFTYNDNGISISAPNTWMSTGDGTVYAVLVARGTGYLYDSASAISVTLVGVDD